MTRLPKSCAFLAALLLTGCGGSAALAPDKVTAVTEKMPEDDADKPLEDIPDDGQGTIYF